MYYYPVSKDNRNLSLPWQIKTFFFNLAWPLKDKIRPCIRIINLSLLSVEFVEITFVIVGNVRFLIQNYNDINLSVEALVTLMVITEFFVRISHMALKRNSFKSYLQEFYSRIYFDEKESPDICRKIRRSLLPTTIFSYGYIVTLVSFLAMPIVHQILGNEAMLPCRVLVDYDIENPLYYNLTLFVMSRLGINILFFFIGEAYLWANCILHLNARYKMLQNEMEHCSSNLIKTVTPSKLALEFRRKILRTFFQVCDLNRFSVLLDATYNCRLFITICLSALMVCVLCFQIVETEHSSRNFGYVSWFMAKISELLIFGTLGSTIFDTTDKISSMYYLSNWEDIIYRSTNTKQNIILLKHLHIVILLHRNSIQMTGFNFFVVSIATSVKVLRVSCSYLAFLYTIKKSTIN